ncbi:MAG: HAD-IA family hydrolase [Gammaproteobacteria bacterium]|nr:HAD-IA family hydrolase [Gammaproteobacteria bacterium]
MGGKPCRIPDAVLFDLDGTLLDTAEDLVAALNTILDEDGRPPMPLDTFRPWVSQGGLTLVSMAYGLPRESEEAQALWQRYLAAYESDISRHSCLFDGLEGILAGLESGSRPWGIVTNKPTYLTDRLLRELGMRDRPACMVCSDTAPRSKPWPDPVLLACEIMEVPPERALMVGDDERDVASARAAGADAVVAAWGYIRPDDDPATWGASAILPRPAALRSWVG